MDPFIANLLETFRKCETDSERLAFVALLTAEERRAVRRAIIQVLEDLFGPDAA